MIRLFKDYDSEWKDEAHDLYKEILDALGPVTDKWVAKGYSPREISHMAAAVASNLEIQATLSRKFREKKEV